ncbi:hypothetical protein K7X08_000857 [Anisodus acutangulus]|uniref:Uncharacterized protein n=1 Tax=Anisodus acutangulus TaxID=402998 RepID=A0A9Q1RMU9_9SOLA|nr:hypothetical protein K7X08_000857 [Anisodus acutangulus]
MDLKDHGHLEFEDPYVEGNLRVLNLETQELRPAQKVFLVSRSSRSRTIRKWPLQKLGKCYGSRLREA